ncbi:hypothetical protein GCM10018962_42930 [Dactylosporangium matsuzakiense]|uniref:Uncharacterized protein n=1 Tax=Dactylosporangium matsuzakiense TaxID=53360 RepID=A0A9W6KE82_9ACTN|nr:hypothetical protein GCM10017581_016280 [Dactylosporangium matsuzakiense]
MIVAVDSQTAEVSCDRCGDTFNATGADRGALWDRAQAIGWQTERLGGMWWHRCPGCAGRFAGGPRPS